MGHEAVLASSGAEGLRTSSRRQAARRRLRHHRSQDGRGGRPGRGQGACSELDPDCPVMIVTAFGTVETAVEAMKLGAFDFLQKPFAPEVRAAQGRARARAARANGARRERAEAEVEALRADAAADYRFAEIVGDTRADARACSRPSRRSRRTDISGASSTANRAPARSWSRAPSTTRSKRAGGPVREGQLRRADRDAARDRAVRPREGRVHRRDQAQARPVRAGRQGHAVPRRGRRHDAGAAGQAAARAAGARVRARRRRGDHQGRRARRLRDPPGPQGRGRGGALPRGPVLPPARRALHGAAAARAHARTSRCWSRTSSPSWRRAPTRRCSGIDDAALARLCAHHWPGNVRELENAIEQALVFAEGDAIDVGALPAFLRERPAREHAGAAGRRDVACPRSSRTSSAS